ncbi:hypothetical protein BH11PLA2_BH11PLA2_01990 [soil metagenome]
MTASENILSEFRGSWLPHISDCGLDRVVELLATSSPLLIHGAFTRCLPMGCLATHVAWNHPQTEHLNVEAGVMWLTRVARLNPATSQVILAWDRAGIRDWELRDALLSECRVERDRRREAFERICDTVDCGQPEALSC